MEEIMKKTENLLPKDIAFVKPQPQPTPPQQIENKQNPVKKIPQIKNGHEQNTNVNPNEKENTKSVVVNPLRAKFRKSQTCGSLFAKCDCNPPTSTTNPQERRALFQSYSHPDTPFIFTNENKNPLESPTGGSGESVNKNREKHFATKDGTVIISNPKRLSSPNIGNYAVLDVEIHPEIVLKVTKPGPRRVVSESPTSIKSLTVGDDDHFAEEVIESLTRISNRRTQSENAAYSNHTHTKLGPCDVFEDDESAEIVEPVQVKRTEEISSFSFLTQPQNHMKSHKFTPISNNLNNTTATDVDSKATHNNLEYLKFNALSYQQENLLNVESAAKFFQESGILGPIMGNGVSTRKSSKIQDSTNIIEQVRRTSKAIIKRDATTDHRQTADDDKLKQYQEEVTNLKEIIKYRDEEINKLKREIDKLKSVLHKTVGIVSSGDLLSSLQTHHCMPGQHHQSQAAAKSILLSNQSSITQQKNFINNINSNNKIIHNNLNQVNHVVDLDGSDLGKSRGDNIRSNNFNKNIVETAMHHHSSGTMLKNLLTSSSIMKKQGVSAESCDVTGQRSSDILITKFDKDFSSKQLIKDAIMDNDFLKNIDSSQVRELVDSMYSRQIGKGEYVIREGEAGAHLYVSAEGEFEVIKGGNVLGVMGPGKAFGELAILYNCTRTASIRVMQNSKVWVLDRRVFQQIMMRTGMQRIEENVNFLKSVPLLKNLSNDVLTKIADVLEVEFYPAGAYIIRQGASGDTFYLISQGNVKVTQRPPDGTVEEEIRTLERGDYFGEQALIKEDKRTANIIALPPGVECLTLDRASFTQLIGDLCELHEKDYGDEERMFTCKKSTHMAPSLTGVISEEFINIKLKDFCRVATLGLGGFGRVELVKLLKNTGDAKAYALKCLKKQHIVDTRQEDHVFSERTIMLSCDSPFICRLYQTFRDNKYVYMLLEACMGGEIWTILRDRGSFDDYTTQFIIGCVLQAFEYLHARGIVYRDLKPENLMLDSKGYVKLVDFGFAKYIGYSSKTWTFCGTPEYVAPEIILNKGHDRAVDYWALGVLIHELLTGTPPFTASDPMKTYNIILKGIDMVDFPRYMSRSAIGLIKRLCRDVPAERLGYQKGGIQDIKKNKWFQGFDWDGLASLTLLPPIIHPVRHALDTSYFDQFPLDTDVPPDETSGWDIDF